MSIKNVYKPRYKIAFQARNVIWPYKNSRLRRFFNIRGRKLVRSGLLKRNFMVFNNLKWTVVRRYIRPYMMERKAMQKNMRYKMFFYRKQQLRHFYGKVSEEVFRNFFKRFLMNTTSRNKTFFASLECRLDMVIFRMRILPTIYACHQLVHHHGVLLNRKLKKSPQELVRIGDVIEIGRKQWKAIVLSFSHRIFYRNYGLKTSKRRRYRLLKKKCRWILRINWKEKKRKPTMVSRMISQYFFMRKLKANKQRWFDYFTTLSNQLKHTAYYVKNDNLKKNIDFKFVRGLDSIKRDYFKLLLKIDKYFKAWYSFYFRSKAEKEEAKAKKLDKLFKTRRIKIRYVGLEKDRRKKNKEKIKKRKKNTRKLLKNVTDLKSFNKVLFFLLKNNEQITTRSNFLKKSISWIYTMHSFLHVLNKISLKLRLLEINFLIFKYKFMLNEDHVLSEIRSEISDFFKLNNTTDLDAVKLSYDNRINYNEKLDYKRLRRKLKNFFYDDGNEMFHLENRTLREMLKFLNEKRSENKGLLLPSNMKDLIFFELIQSKEFSKYIVDKMESNEDKNFVFRTGYMQLFLEYFKTREELSKDLNFHFVDLLIEKYIPLILEYLEVRKEIIEKMHKYNERKLQHFSKSMLYYVRTEKEIFPKQLNKVRKKKILKSFKKRKINLIKKSLKLKKKINRSKKFFLVIFRYKNSKRIKTPRLKKMHFYIPSHIHFDFKTLRGVLLYAPKPNEIFHSFRVPLAQIYSFYKSRGY